MATLVECVRSSRSMQTQQAALMVMSSVAPLIPDYVLHNVMLIFTFVGSGLLKQDDSHSFQVIEHTILEVLTEARHDSVRRMQENATCEPRFRACVDNVNDRDYFLYFFILVFEQA